MPMQGKRLKAKNASKGMVIPVQVMPSRSVEPREISDTFVEAETHLVHVAFTDGTAWTWNENDDILDVRGT